MTSAPDKTGFLDYLASVHRRTRQAVMCIPPQDIEWAAGPGRFTFGDIVRHLANIERWMYAENAAGRPSRYAGHGREFADGLDQVVAYYDRLHDESRAIFAGMSAEAWGGRCVTPAGTSISTWKWLRAMVEHEAHHRGQLYLILGLRGVATPPLFGLTSEAVAQRAK